MIAAEHWLSIVGIGEDGWDGLNHEAKRAITSTELLYGGARHLALIPTLGSSATLRVAEVRGKRDRLLSTNHRVTTSRPLRA